VHQLAPCSFDIAQESHRVGVLFCGLYMLLCAKITKIVNPNK